ncbi:MAG: dTDP-4-dehydrorhamnose reductase [Calditrichaeota bacterium]|nr:dTDP-4-dehydrorhamnose reductase [Calditrichota bacterium]
MKVLITGSAGMLGQKLLTTLSGDLYALTGCDLAPAPPVEEVPCHYLQLDVTDRKQTIAEVKAIAPAVIVHTAAMTNVDACETRREECWRSNVYATENVALAGRLVGARIIYISTDYVFDGRAGPYDEEARPNPVSYYGKSKLAGENVIRGNSGEWTIVRTIVLYGYGRDARASFITWLLGELRAGRPVKIVDDQWGNTTIADDLAAAIDRIILLQKSGLYHVGGAGFSTRYEFALTAARVFGLDESLIHPITTESLAQPAKRPLRSGLMTQKAEEELFLTFRTAEDSLRLYREQEAQGALKGVF